MTTEALGETIRRVLRDAPFAMRQLAADAGLSYDVLRSWRSGRRRPSRGSAERLADGLERRGEQLLALSRELRQAAEEKSDDRANGRQGDRSAGMPGERPVGMSRERPVGMSGERSAGKPADRSETKGE